MRLKIKFCDRLSNPKELGLQKDSSLNLVLTKHDKQYIIKFQNEMKERENKVRSVKLK